MLNTLISYIYRDAANYQQHERIVLAGELSQADLTVIKNNLIDGQFFIPEQVGIEPLQERFSSLDVDDDHPYHELDCDDIHLTDDPSSSTLTTKQLVENFRMVVWDFIKADEALWRR